MQKNIHRPVPWSSEAFKRMGYQAIDLIAAYLETLPEKAVFTPVPAEVVDTFLNQALPEAGTTPEHLLKTFQETIMPYALGNGHPRFFGWVNSPPVPIGVIAELLASAMNPSCAGGNHSAVWVESQVINWFKQMLDFPQQGTGLLVSGGSMASLTALSVARQAHAGYDVRAQGMRQSEQKLILYISREGHGCLHKAAHLLGIGDDNIRIIAVDKDDKMCTDDLEKQIKASLALNHKPFAICASMGTANTGAIDPLEEIAALARHYQIWFHIDGAYGAPAVLTHYYRAYKKGLALADSITLDPHKWFCIPVDAGLVLIKHAQLMRETFSLVPPYLQTDNQPQGVQGLPWFSEYGFEQTRSFRALKIWMALKQYGLNGYQQMITDNIADARYLHQCIVQAPDLEAIGQSSLSIVCFHCVPQRIKHTQASLNTFNQRLLKNLQLEGHVFVSGTTRNNTFVLRACIVNFLTQRKDIDFLVKTVQQTAKRLILQDTTKCP